MLHEIDFLFLSQKIQSSFICTFGIAVYLCVTKVSRLCSLYDISKSTLFQVF